MDLQQYLLIRQSQMKTKLTNNPSQESFISKIPSNGYLTKSKPKLKNLKDLQIFKKIVAQMNAKSTTNQGMQIRRLLPQKQNLEKIEMQNTAYLHQTNSYFNSRKSSLQQSQNMQTLDEIDTHSPVNGSGSMILCKQLFTTNNSRDGCLRNRSLTQKIVIVNHQGKPTTYYKKKK